MNVIIASLNTAIERLLLVDKQQPGEVHRMLDDKTLAGGKGVNVARVMRQLGTFLPDAPTPRLLGFLGGATGRLCRELLAEEALEGCWCEIAGSTRICEVVTEVQAPERASVYNALGPAITPVEHQALHCMLVQELPHASALVCTGSLAKNLLPDEYGRWITSPAPLACCRCWIPTARRCCSLPFHCRISSKSTVMNCVRPVRPPPQHCRRPGWTKACAA